MRPAAIAICLVSGTATALPGCVLANLDCLWTNHSELEFNEEADVTTFQTDQDPLFLSQPLFEQIAGRIGSHASCIAAMDDGELLAVWYSYVGPHELDGSAVYLARRPPGAESWDAPQLVVDGPLRDGNPVIHAEGDRVWLFHAVVPFGWSTAHVEVRVSEDRGRTWGPDEAIGAPVGLNVRNKPIRLPDGSLLLPCYDEIVPRSVFLASDGVGPWALLGESVPIPSNIQPAVVRLDDGRLLAALRNPARGEMWVMHSDNEGRCWSSPSASGFANPGSACDLLRLGNGHLILALNDSADERLTLSIALSTDEGRTWPFRRKVDVGQKERSYPSLTQTPDGLVHLTYTRGRERIQHVILNEAWIAGEE